VLGVDQTEKLFEFLQYSRIFTAMGLEDKNDLFSEISKNESLN
jgi:hypothetical protein